MTSRSTSFTARNPQPVRRPSSLTSRLSFAVSTAERGEGADVPVAQAQQIDDEIAEIKRYEVGRPGALLGVEMLTAARCRTLQP